MEPRCTDTLKMLVLDNIYIVLGASVVGKYNTMSIFLLNSKSKGWQNVTMEEKAEKAKTAKHSRKK